MNKRKQKKIAKKIYELCEKTNIATPINLHEIFYDDDIGHRAFISQDGDDNNDCSPLHPCKSMKRALQVSHGGYIFVLPNRKGSP